jgi:hypothetical protein
LVRRPTTVLSIVQWTKIIATGYAITMFGIPTCKALREIPRRKFGFYDMLSQHTTEQSYELAP